MAGLTAAWLLAPRHDVVLYEKDTRPGGHTRTVIVPAGPDAGTPIDTGFIVFNPQNYPMFGRLLERLEVSSQASDMSFSYHRVRDGFHWAGNGLDGLFARRRSLVSLAHLRMIGDLLRFNQRARSDLRAGRLAGVSIDDYVRELRLSAGFRDCYLAPMAAAIWSTRPAEVLAFPAAAFLRFFENHGLLQLVGAPAWRTITGGSAVYVEALLARFGADGGVLRLGEAVHSVRRDAQGVLVTAGESERFDRVVIAAHADEALGMLESPTSDERRLLGAWRYTTNHSVLHADTTVLPPHRRAWASWNYEEEETRSGPAPAPVCVTYWMNRLQRLRTRNDWCVTLNRRTPVDERTVVDRARWMHPCFDARSLATQAELPQLNGVLNTYYCGSYFRYGFHEDAVVSAAAVGAAFGGAL